ncbi:hypothetical protein LXL04_019252 [Taraxacum kok-saghyz]
MVGLTTQRHMNPSAQINPKPSYHTDQLQFHSDRIVFSDARLLCTHASNGAVFNGTPFSARLQLKIDLNTSMVQLKIDLQMALLPLPFSSLQSPRTPSLSLHRHHHRITLTAPPSPIPPSPLNTSPKSYHLSNTPFSDSISALNLPDLFELRRSRFTSHRFFRLRSTTTATTARSPSYRSSVSIDFFHPALYSVVWLLQIRYVFISIDFRIHYFCLYIIGRNKLVMHQKKVLSMRNHQRSMLDSITRRISPLNDFRFEHTDRLQLHMCWLQMCLIEFLGFICFLDFYVVPLDFYQVDQLLFRFQHCVLTMAMRKHVNCWWGYSKQVMSRHGNCWWWLTLEIQVLSHMCCIEGYLWKNADLLGCWDHMLLLPSKGYFRYSVTGNDRTASNDVDQCLSSNTTIIPTDMLRGIFVRREQPPLDASF